jgi:pyruvate-ferredoxin/flavodoxin oxidoreductase
MFLANAQIREGLADSVKVLADGSSPVADKAQKWLETYEDGEANNTASKDLKEALADAVLSGDEAKAAKAIEDKKDFLNKKSQWIFGGDGWAYDIGFGGLDHVLAQNRDVNILVFDTEVYSNTGGQASKATPTGAIAQFAASGKVVKKKDLAAIAMSYGYVYVAQCSMGADKNQVVKALREAESYNGPSLIICYAPCINHGIKGWQKGIAQIEEKKAVDAGYWHNFRFDPRKTEQGENPFSLDSKAPSADYKEFILGENRYNRLAKAFPDKADTLFEHAANDAKEKYERLTRYEALYKPE